MPSTAELWLSLDLSGQKGSICVHAHQSGRVEQRAEVHLDDAGKHSESVLAGIQAALAQAEIELKDISRFLTSSGPGSFTGLRVGFAALKAFSLAGGQTLEVIDGHEVLALHHLMQTAPGGEASIAVATRITRESWLVSHFRTNGQAGADLASEKIEPTSTDALVVPMQARYLAETLGLVKSRRTYQTAEEIAAATPNYFGSRFE